MIGIIEGFIDYVFRDQVRPKIGSVVYCDLWAVEHSGIYIGDNRIVHLDGSGKIEIVTPKQFIERLDGFNNAINIYVSCKDTQAVGSSSVAQIAEVRVGEILDYDIILNNCHKFTYECISGDLFGFNGHKFTLSDVKKAANKYMGVNTWRMWESHEYGKFIIDE